MAARDKVLATPRPLEEDDEIQSVPSVPESVATWRQSLLVAEKVIYNVTTVNQAMDVLSRRHFAPYQKIPKVARMKKILLRPTIPRMRESFATSTTVTTPSSAQEFGSSETSYTIEQVDVLGTPDTPSCPSTTGNDETESGAASVDPLVEPKIDLQSSDEPEEDDVHDQTMEDEQAHEIQDSMMEFSAIPEVTITPLENDATSPSAIIAERQQDLIDESATSSAVLASSVSEYDEVTTAMEIGLAHREDVDRQDDDMASSWSHTHDAQDNLEVANDNWIRGSENDDSSMYEVTSSDQTAMEFDLATEIWAQVDELRLQNDIVSLASQAPSDVNMITLDAVEGDFLAGEYLPAPTFGTGGFGLFEQTHFPVGIDLVCGRDAFAQPDIRAARSEDPSVLYPALVTEGELPHNLHGEGTLGNQQSASLPRTYPNIDLDYGEAVDEGIGAMSNQDYMQLYPALFQTNQSVYSTSATEFHIPAVSDWDIETPDEASGKGTIIAENIFTSVDYTCLDEKATIAQILGEVPFAFPVAAPSLPSQGTNVDEQNNQPLWIAEQHQAVHDLIFGQVSPPQNLLEFPIVPEAMPEEEPWKRGQAEAMDLLRSLAEHQKQDPFLVIMTDIPTVTSTDSGRHIDSTGRMVEVRRWKPSKPQAKPVASGVSPPASLTQSEALLSVLANNAEENEINNAPAPTFMPSVTPHAHPAPLTTEGLVQLQGYNGTDAVMIDPLLVSAEAVLANNPGLERSAALQQAFAQVSFF
ncbi:hypothetical protein QFC21_001896 [Naganishia friedmannii]|uniref:Uncharacterized protein n=1 Tax=Naganishia friedmannii TaxID=89922 RepID=A0ACC2W342_9TREE|nr:hypothetical protein QFC21_001896 [Naganishia friedmannii]